MENYKDCKLNNIYFREGENGVECTINQAGVCATYPLLPARFEPKADALLMDLDGTTVKSEEFWIYLIEKTVKTLMKDEKVAFTQEDIPYVSGFSTIEHLTYALNKYHVNCDVSDANSLYHTIAEYELKEIMEGRGNASAFKPREGLKEFLQEVKGAGIKVGLVTSGLDYKAIPEILSTFRVLGMGDPLDFYDAIITGGKRKIAGQYGSLGELSVKPHPWVYAEIGLSLGKNKEKIITLEDSSSGVLSSRLAGYGVLGLSDGNIKQSGVESFCEKMVDTLEDVYKAIR